MASLVKRVMKSKTAFNLSFSKYSHYKHKTIQFRKMSSNAAEEVILEAKKTTGIVTLNRPKALNALNLDMVRSIYPQLVKWRDEGLLELIIMKGAGGKAFCAGGDIRSVTESVASGGTLHKEFFKEEYILNHAISTLPIPYVAIIDGITMGGGVGLSVHGRFRLATEKTLFAMPETAIGLFPDVGGGHFLPRLEGQLGIFLALTGFRLKGRDVFRAGVATHFCESSKVDLVEKELQDLSNPGFDDVAAVLDAHHESCKLDEDKPYALQDHLSTIDETFDSPTVEGIVGNLEKNGSDWALKQVATIAKMSPTSLKITLEQLRRGASMSLQDVLRMEYRLSQACANDHDFTEGVRAVLVDKDMSPSWQPNSLDRVTPARVDSYFEELPKNDELIF